MNLQEFRVLNAAAGMPGTFTNGNLCRKAGVSEDVARTTCERHAKHFQAMQPGHANPGSGIGVDRQVTVPDRGLLLAELDAARPNLEAPPAPQNADGIPLSLLGAEAILDDLLPLVDSNARSDLIEEAAGLVELAEACVPVPGADLADHDASTRSRLASARARCEQARLGDGLFGKATRG